MIKFLAFTDAHLGILPKNDISPKYYFLLNSINSITPLDFGKQTDTLPFNIKYIDV